MIKIYNNYYHQIIKPIVGTYLPTIIFMLLSFMLFRIKTLYKFCIYRYLE